MRYNGLGLGIEDQDVMGPFGRRAVRGFSAPIATRQPMMGYDPSYSNVAPPAINPMSFGYPDMGGASPGTGTGTSPNGAAPSVSANQGHSSGMSQSADPSSSIGHPDVGTPGFSMAVNQSNANMANNPTFGKVVSMMGLTPFGIPTAVSIPLSIATSIMGYAANTGPASMGTEAQADQPSPTGLGGLGLANPADSMASVGGADPGSPGDAASGSATAGAAAGVGDGGGAGAGSGGEGAGDGAGAAGGESGGDGAWRFGGPVKKDGDGKLEAVKGTVHEGEYVIRPEAVKVLGRSILDTLNRAHEMTGQELATALSGKGPKVSGKRRA